MYKKIIKAIKSPLWAMNIIKYSYQEKIIILRTCRCFKNKKGIRIGGTVLLDSCFLHSSVVDVNIEKERFGEKNKLDYLTDAANLYFSKNNEYDFVVSSHVLEHLADPISAIYEWKRVVKNNGLIYCAIPDKRFTFDRKRKRTSLEHLIKDYHNKVKQSDKTHIDEFIKNYDIDMDSSWENKNQFLNFIKENPESSIHHHVWEAEDIVELFNYCNVKIIHLKLIGNTVHLLGVV